MKNDNKAIVYACLAVLSWSTVATAFKVALRSLTYFELLLVASLTSLVIFTVLLTFQRKWKLVCSLSAKQWGYFSGMGLLNPVAYYLSLFSAYSLLPAQVAQPINYAWPIVLLILLALFCRTAYSQEKIHRNVCLAGRSRTHLCRNRKCRQYEHFSHRTAVSRTQCCFMGYLLDG